MKTQMRKCVAVGMAILMLFQVAHIENYRYIKEVLAEAVEEQITIQGGELSESLEVVRPTTLEGDLTVNGDLTLYAPLDLNGYTLTINGSCNQCKNLSLNGTLVVTEDYDWQMGTLNFEQGKLCIEKNFNLCNGGEKIWIMQQEDAYLFVGQNINLEAHCNLTTQITDGVIELQGNFIQNVENNFGRLSYYSNDFIAGENNKLLLSGNGKQNIYISKEDSTFQNVEVATKEWESEEVANEQEVSFSQYCNYVNYESNGCPTNYGFVCVDGESLTKDTYLYGNAYLKEGTMKLNGNALYVQGDLIQNGNMILDTGSLYVSGEYKIAKIISSDQMNEYKETTAIVDSTDNCRVYIYQNFTTESVSDHSDLLTNGQWYFYGDIIQKGTTAINFATSRSWKGYMQESSPKRDERKIHLDNPINNPLNALTVNGVGGEVKADNGIMLTQATQDAVCGIEGTMYLDNRNFGLCYYNRQGDYVVVGPVDLKGEYVNTSQKLIVRSDIQIESGSYNWGDLIVEAGTITIDNANIYAGNITFTDGGSGTLCMQNENAYLHCKSLYIGSDTVSGTLSAGNIDITGDLTQKDNGTPNNFVTTEQMQLCMANNYQAQIVHFDSMESEIENMYIKNGSGGCTVFETDVNVHNLYDDSHRVRGKETLGYVLDKDVVYLERTQLCAGVMDLNGHTLTVENDLILSGGVIKLNGGTLIVKGDLRCQDMYEVDGTPVYGATTAQIIMEKEEDHMILQKDWYMQLRTIKLDTMKAGTIELAGNYEIQNDAYRYDPVGSTVIGGAGLIFNGNQKQRVTWSGESGHVVVGDLCVENLNGVEADIVYEAKGKVMVKQGESIFCKSIHVDSAEQIACKKIEGDVYIHNDGAFSQDVTIKGMLTNAGVSDLAGYTLRADTIWMKAYFRMNRPEDTIYVNDLNIELNQVDNGYMTDGTIHIYDDFWERSSTHCIFHPSGKHTVVFYPQEKNNGRIYFSKEESKFNIAVLKGKLNNYVLDREKEEIADKVILDYEDEDAPQMLDAPTCIDKTCRSVTLTWNDAEDNMEIEKYIVYRDGIRIGTTHKTGYVDLLLEPDTLYSYEIQAQDAKGNVSKKTKVKNVKTNDDHVVPYMTHKPRISASDKKVTISFGGSFTDDESYVDHYIVMRDGKIIANIPATAYLTYKGILGETMRYTVQEGETSYTDTSVVKRQVYQYMIYAVDMAGNCSEQYQMEAITDPLPEAAEEFTLTSEDKRNYISFVKSGLRECGYYEIYRRPDYISQYTKIATIVNDKNEEEIYEDVDVFSGGKNYYYIVSYSADGTTGGKTNEKSVITSKDHTPPEITDIQYQIDGDIVNEDLEFIVNAKDNGNIKEIRSYYTKDGDEEEYSIAVKEKLVHGKNASYRFLFETDGLKGTYVVHMVAEDGCGNCTEKQKSVQVNCAGLDVVTIQSMSATSDSVTLKWDAVNGAEQYQVEMLRDNSYVICNKISEQTDTIRGLYCNKEYQFRVVAYDKAGIRGRNAGYISVKTKTDTEKPVIKSVDSEDKVYTDEDKLYLSYIDNIEVAEAFIHYRAEGEEEWKDVGTTRIRGRGGSVHIAWDKAELPSGRYEIKYQISDTSGNLSESVIQHCIIDKDAPVIHEFTLIPGDWTITLKWKTFDETDYDRYRLYRIDQTGKETFLTDGTKDTSYTEIVSPKETYTYRLYVWDVYGNVTHEDIQGTSIDNDTICPTVGDIPDMYAAVDTIMKLTIPECSDNDAIASYIWDMGNGDTVEGEYCNYIYEAEGTYTASLAVTDVSGNRSTKQFRVTVENDTGLLQVTVRGNNSVLKDADVVLRSNGVTYHSSIGTTTDGKGIISFPVEEGTYQIAAYKDGYKPKDMTVTVEKGNKKEVTIELEQNSLISASITSKKMTHEEMEKEGIDTDKNRAVYDYTLALKYEKEEIPTLKFDNRNESKNRWTFEVPIYNESGDGMHESKEKKRIDITDVSDDPENPVFIVTQTEKISISWLSNVYKVTMMLCNEAGETFGLKNVKVKLSLPKELQLAQMEEGKKNSKTWKLDKLSGGESVDHSWYVTGQIAGTYDVNADVEAYLPTMERKIHNEVVAKNAVTVTVGEGLHLYIYPEENAYIGEKYYIQYKLKNESDEPYYNVETSFGNFDNPDYVMENITLLQYEEDGREEAEPNRFVVPAKVYVPNLDESDKKVIKVNGNHMRVNKLAPGEAIYGTTVRNFNAAGNQYEEYYKLLNQYVDELNDNQTNVRVTVLPISSHIIKTKQKVTIPKKSNYIIHDPARENTEDSTTEDSTTEERTTEERTTETPTKQVKDPVQLMTGAFQSTHTLASVADGEKTVQFELTYDSTGTDAEGDIGRGWSHNYEMHIERMGDFVTLYMNPSQRICFSESEETRCQVSGSVDGDEITLTDDVSIERTYYQTGGGTYYIIKNKNGYQLRMGTDTYLFDTNGELTECVDENGRQVTVKHTERQLIITDVATGKSITADYDKDGHIVLVTDAAGNKASLAYKDGNLVQLVSKSGLTLQYIYDDKGHILKGMERDVIFVENTYDVKGRVLSQISNGKANEKTIFSYQEDSENGNLQVCMTNSDGTTKKAVSDRYGQGISYEDEVGGITTYQYDENHNMIAYRAPDGSGESYTYDDEGNLESITETNGKKYQYTYDEQRHVTSMIGNDGTNVKYTYNEKGQRKTVTGRNGLYAEYTYNEQGQILTEKSGLGMLTYHYENGMLSTLADRGGRKYSFEYDANGNVIRSIDGNGTVRDYKVDVSGRVLSEAVELEDGRKALTIYTYDLHGNVLTSTDPMGNVTKYTYDDEDRVTKTIRPDGSTLCYDYDENGNLTEVIYPDGETTVKAIYDAAGNTLELTDTLKSIQKGIYSPGSQILSLTQANGGEVSYTYYENGLLSSQTDANGNAVVFRYDDAGRVSETEDADGNRTIYRYDVDGNLKEIEDALGNTIQFVYNAYRKIVKQTDANGNVTTYDYDNDLNCIRMTDAEQGITEFAYDANGQILSVTKKGDTADISMSMIYDALGNVTSITDGEGNIHSMEYDLVSNLTAVYDAKGVKTEEYVYDSLGNVVSVTDADGNVITNMYDSFGNLIKQMNESTKDVATYAYIGGRYLAASSDALGNTATMTYDSMGNIATLTNPNGGVTSYTYDLNSNLTEERIGEDYHIGYTYNAQNLVASKTNSRNQGTVYVYDAVGRIIRQTDEEGVIEYSYDANGNVLTVTETKGENVFTITRTYDGLNRVTSYEDGKGKRIGYVYDKVGNLTDVIYPNGKKVTYAYDKNGSIKKLTDWDERITTYDYDVNGRLVKTTRPNGTVETRAYDKMGRLTLILDKAGGTEVNHQEYCYDAAGNITETKSLGNKTLEHSDVSDVKMTYDKNNRLITYNGKDVEYDKDGNMVYGPLQGKMVSFLYDCRNRLVQAGDTTYEYDAENNRIAEINGSRRIEYVINTQPELGQILQSISIMGNRKEETYYYYGNGLTAQDNGTDYLTYHFNNVGSTMAVTDEKGNIAGTYEYSPYGQILHKEGNANITFLYNGQYGVATDENGLYYMRARYYNVDIKRFINQDVLTGTLERISSLNRYAYVEGNPINYLDPFGLAIDTLLNVIGIASTIVSCLRLFEFIAPGVLPVVDTILAFTTIALDIVQCIRYGGDADRLKSLIRNCLATYYDKACPLFNKLLGKTKNIKGLEKASVKVASYFDSIGTMLEDGLDKIINVFVNLSDKEYGKI